MVCFNVKSNQKATLSHVRDTAKATPRTTEVIWTKQFWQCWGITHVWQVMGTKELHSLSVETGLQQSAEVLADWRMLPGEFQACLTRDFSVKTLSSYCFLEHKPPVRELSSLLKHKAMWKLGAGIKLSHFSNYYILVSLLLSEKCQSPSKLLIFKTLLSRTERV